MEFSLKQNTLFASVQTVFILRKENMEMERSPKCAAYDISPVLYVVPFLCSQV